MAQDGSEMSSLADKLERWRDCFEEVSNVSVELEESVISAVLESVPVAPQGSSSDDSLVKVPSEGEIKIALNMMNNGQTPDADGISAELLKLGGKKVLQWLLHLAHVIWEEQKVPKDWLKQLTVPLHRKG